MNISSINPVINNNYQVSRPKKYLSTNNSIPEQSNINFGSGADEGSKFFNFIKEPFEKNISKPLAKAIAKGLGKLLRTDFMNSTLAKATEKVTKGKDSNLLNHLMTIGSVVLSSLYVIRTLTNKDLDEKKRKTLAVNQGLVFAFSTTMCYLVEGKLRANVKKLANKFEAANIAKNEKEALVKECSRGIGAASKVMIFDMIYRFIAPVFITPVANAIGNKLNEQEAQKALINKAA